MHNPVNNPKILSVAPMLDYTDRHYRYLARLFTKHSVLYTEMVTSAAILHGKAQQHLQFHEVEHPVVLQLGGSCPIQLAECARIAEKFGYDEINLNVGCPSSRVQSGRFGACLMREPDCVAECVQAMANACQLPITVKTRLGVDEEESYEFLQNFIATVAAAGCETFILHARKAWLKGLSPKQNRSVPPLNYQRVYDIKKDFPKLHIHINGGISTLAEVKEHLPHVDGVMIGRAAYQNPYLLMAIEQELFAETPPSLLEITQLYCRYMAKEIALGTPMTAMSRHLIPLFHGRSGAKSWRHLLSEQIRSISGIDELYQALSLQITKTSI